MFNLRAITINDWIAVAVDCRMCSAHFEISVRQADRWQSGELVQRALPYLSADDRELLKTQTCGKCWEKMFPKPKPKP